MPNSRQGPSEGSDEDRGATSPSNNSSGNNMDQQDVAVGAGRHGHNPAPGAPRRDENSISFRHFLQPHSDVVPSPAPTCRRSRGGAQTGAVDLVDMAMALPDFVQDHLVVESLAIAEQHNDGTPSGAPAVDLSVLNEVLPDFTTSQATVQAGHSRRRNIPEEHPIVPEVPHAAPGTSALPDFLSDGPMQCTDSNVVDNTLSGPTSSRATSRILGSSHSLVDRSRTVDEPSRSASFDAAENLRLEIDLLRREIEDRNRRIAQLESDITRWRSNANTLEAALRTAEQNAANSEMRRQETEAQFEVLKHLAAKGRGSNCSEPSIVKPSTSGTSSINGNVSESFELNSHSIQDIAQSSEALISQLLQNIFRLKGLANAGSNEVEAHSKKKPEKDEQGNN